MFEGKPIVVDGIHIPSDNPLFLIVLSVHIVAALACVIAGIFAMFAKKRPGIHPRAGTVYYWSLLVVLLTVIIIAISRWEEDYHLFVLGLLSFASAFIGRRALKLKWHKWPLYHVSGMGVSYIILLTSFYVDNGKFLPIWKEFPTIIYWILPGIIGIPIIVIVLFRHPVVRMYK